MKILHIDLERYWGGGQNQVYLLNKFLLKRNINSYVFTPLNSPLYLRLNQEGFYVYPYTALSLILFIKRTKPDILHIHSGRGHFISHIAKLLYPDIKVVITRRIAKGIKFLPLRKHFIDAIICISEGVRNVFNNSGFDENRIFTIYSGVEKNSSYEAFEPPFWYNSKSFIVGNIAHLLPYKDHKTLITGFANFSKYVSDSKLIIIGEGKEREKLEILTKELSISNKVIFTGFLSNPERYIKYFSVFAITSVDTEGLCTSIIDAFFSGIPVIATDIDGIKELVLHKNTGLLIEKKNPQELEKALIEIKENEPLRKKITSNASNYALRFTAENMGMGNLTIYKRVLGVEK